MTPSHTKPHRFSPLFTQATAHVQTCEDPLVVPYPTNVQWNSGGILLTIFLTPFVKDACLNWSMDVGQDSYIALESAFRILGEFYSKKGPQAALPEDIRTRVLEDLSKADDSI